MAGKNTVMNSQTLGLRLSGTIFAVVCVAHLWRLFRHSDIIIGGYAMPMWASVVGLIIAGIMSIWMFRISATRGS